MKQNKQTLKLKESQLRNIIKESIKNVLKENTENVWDLLEDMKQYMSSDDILARLISRIGEYTALKCLEDIKTVETDSYLNDDADVNGGYETKADYEERSRNEVNEPGDGMY